MHIKITPTQTLRKYYSSLQSQANQRKNLCSQRTAFELRLTPLLTKVKCLPATYNAGAEEQKYGSSYSQPMRQMAVDG
jgi:hypothetical protein